MGDVTYREGERVEAHGFGWGWDRPVGGTIEAPRGLMAPGSHRVLLDTGESVVRMPDEIRPTAETIAALRAVVVAYADEPSLSLASEEAWGRCVERYDARSQPVYTTDPAALRRLYDAIAEAGRRGLPSRLKVAMQAVERALHPMRVVAAPEGDRDVTPPNVIRATAVRVECGGKPVLLDGEPIFVDLGSPAPARAEMGRELRALLLAPESIAPATSSASAAALAGDVTRKRFGLPRHEDPVCAPDAPPPADPPSFPATCLLCGAPAYHGAISAECSRGARCGIADPLPMPTRVSQTEYLAPALGVASETIWVAEGAGAWAYHPIREEAIARWRTALRANAEGASILDAAIVQGAESVARAATFAAAVERAAGEAVDAGLLDALSGEDLIAAANDLAARKPGLARVLWCEAARMPRLGEQERPYFSPPDHERYVEGTVAIATLDGALVALADPGLREFVRRLAVEA